MHKPRLPKKPSELIRLALDDLEKCEKDFDTYVIDMDVFHEPTLVEYKSKASGPLCAVCLAGAVMAQTFKIPPCVETHLGDFDFFSTADSGRLLALDCFRMGKIREALFILSKRSDLHIDDALIERAQERVYIPPYSYASEFHSAMMILADDLQSRGL